MYVWQDLSYVNFFDGHLGIVIHHGEDALVLHYLLGAVTVGQPFRKSLKKGP